MNRPNQASWITSDIPGVQKVLSTESTDDSKSCDVKINSFSSVASDERNSMSRWEDNREEQSNIRGSRDRIDRVGFHEDEEMGFEVEVSLGDTSTNPDSARESFSSKASESSSRFDHIKSSYDNFKSFSNRHQAPPRSRGGGAMETSHCSPSDGRETPDSIERSMKPALKVNSILAGKEVVGVAQKVTVTRRYRDETPKINNRSGKPFDHSSHQEKGSIASLKGKSKEKVSSTLATIVQRVESPVKRMPSDEVDLSDSSAEVDARWEHFSSKILSEASSGDSSAEVDARWDTLSSKILSEGGPSMSRDTVFSDDYHWRDTLLDVNSATSPRSLFSGEAEGFEDELIQDCIDTGMPSPTKRKETSRDVPPVSHQMTECDDDAETFSDHDECSNHSYPSSLPRLHLREKSESNIDEEQNSVGQIPSALTGEDDDGHETSALDDKEFEESSHGALATLSSCSEGTDQKTRFSPSLDAVLSVDSGAQSCESQEELQHSPYKDELDECPGSTTIEVSLQSSTSCSERTESTQHAEDPVPQISNHHAPKQSTVQQEPRRLEWWCQNGRKLVDEKRGTSFSKTRQIESSTDLTVSPTQVIRPTTSVGTVPMDLDIGRKTSILNESSSDSDSSTSSKHRKSAFMRGLAMFEKGPNSSRKEATSHSRGDSSPNVPLRLSPQPNPNDRKHARAPQPNADAVSSNSRDQEESREAKVADQERDCESVVDEIVNDPSIGSISETNSSEDLTSQRADEGENSCVEADQNKQHVVFTGRRHLEHGGQAATNKVSDGDESEFNAEIIQVASSMTMETADVASDRLASDNETQPSTPVLKVTKKLDGQVHNPREFVDKTIEMSVGYKTSRSFDTKMSASTTGIPSWRLEPTESLADFTIEVTGGVEPVSFFVHKCILAVGPRRSEYLEELFRSEHLSSTSLELVEGAIPLMSHVLDYVYCRDFDVALTTENVVGFRYVAQAFKIIPMLVKTTTFLLNDIKIENMSTYITEGSKYNDTMLNKFIAAKCGEMLERISISDVLWTAMEPCLFLKVVSCPLIDREALSAKLSLLLVEYQMLHKYEMDAKTFSMASAESIIPVIDRDAAIPLLEVCEEYGAPVVFHPLQKRCAHVMACNWKITTEHNRRRLFVLLRSLPSNFTVDFLETVESYKSSRLVESIQRASRGASASPPKADNYESASTFTLSKLCGVKSVEEIGMGEKYEPLSWRTDPTLTFSDWTIKVSHRNSEDVDVYHVHKHILSIGQFKSNFFCGAFISGENAHARRGTTIIELAVEPAQLIPVMLDFIYSPNHNLEISTETAPALRFLARVFGVWMLNKKVLEFVHQDMTLDNMPSYLERSEHYDDNRIVTIAIHKCATSIQSVDPESELVRCMKSDFFGRVVASPDIDKSASCHINLLIAKFFTVNELNETVLAELMKQVPMKEIDFESALKLLEVMTSVHSKGVAIFGDIRKRCCNVLVENWKELREENRELAFEILRTLESPLLADLFDAVENDYYQQYFDTMTLQSKLVKRYRAQLTEAKQQREAEVAQIRQESDERIAALLERQKELEAQLARHEMAGSRRAMRSNGGFAHSRIPSPRHNPGAGSSRESRIPRLGASGKSLQSLSTSYSNPPTGTSAQGASDSSSIFGRMFCGTTPDAVNQQHKLSGAEGLPAGSHYHAHLSGASANNYRTE